MDPHSDPSIPQSKAGHPNPAQYRVGKGSNLRTQVWEATAKNFPRWPREEFVVAKSGVGVSNCPHALILTDLSNAFERAEECVEFRIKTPQEHGRSRKPAKRPEGLALESGSITALMERLKELPGEAFAGAEHSDVYKVEKGGAQFHIYRSTQKGIRTFSALHLGQVKRLTSIPKAWNVRLAMRAILNGQVAKWQVDQVLTDDYARDAARNFRQGELSNFLGKARKVWERPSGWSVRPKNEDRTQISLDCHHFDLNTIEIDLSAEAFEVGKLTCLGWAKEHPADFFHDTGVEPEEMVKPA